MRARLSLVAITALLLATAPAWAKTKPVACTGVFGPDSSAERVAETFGAENVVTGIVSGPEGTELVGTTVFGDDPDKVMEFVWYDEQNHEYISSVRLAPSQTAPGGVRIGMTPAEVEALNGAPFRIGGFWWDYGGYGIIEQGALAEVDGECYLAIRFAPADDIDPEIDVTAVTGEVQVRSDAPLLERIDTRVEVLSLGYPWPEALPQPKY